MKDESSCRSSSFDKLRNAHVSEDLIVVVVAMRVCLGDGSWHGINGRNDLRFVNHSERPNAVFEDDELWSLRIIQIGRASCRERV